MRTNDSAGRVEEEGDAGRVGVWGGVIRFKLTSLS